MIADWASSLPVEIWAANIAAAHVKIGSSKSSYFKELQNNLRKLKNWSRGVHVRKWRSYPKIFKFSLINVSIFSIFSLIPKFAKNSHL